MHRRPLGQEFRIGCHLHLHVMNQKILDKLFHLVVGSHRNRRFYHYKTILLHCLCDLAGNRGYITQIGASVRHLRRSHTDKYRIRIPIRLYIIRGKVQRPSGIIFLHQFFQPLLINGRNSLTHQSHLSLVDIHTHHIVALFRKTYPCYQSYITGSCNCNFHLFLFPPVFVSVFCFIKNLFPIFSVSLLSPQAAKGRNKTKYPNTYLVFASHIM